MTRNRHASDSRAYRIGYKVGWVTFFLLLALTALGVYALMRAVR